MHTKWYVMKYICLVLLSSLLIASEPLRLSLKDAEQLALENNKLLLDLKEQISAASSYKKEKISKWLPQLRMSYFMYQDTIENPLSGAKSNFLTHIGLTQQLFHSDTYFGIILSKYGVQLAHDLYTSAVNDVLLAVRTQYYKVLTDYHLIDAAEEHVALLNQLAQQMRDRYEIGTSIEYNVNQSMVAVSNALQTYYSARKSLKNDVDALSKVLGFTPGELEITLTENAIPLEEIPFLSSKIDRVDTLFTSNGDEGPIYTPFFPGKERSILAHLFTHPEMLSLNQKALASNPVLHKIKTEFSIAHEEVKAAYGAYAPKLSISANAGGIPDPFEFYPSSRFSNMKFDAGVGLNFSWTLFDSFGREHRVQRAKYKKNAARFRLEKEQQEVIQDVRAQIHSLEESMAQFTSARSNDTLATQTLYQSKEQLEVGYIDIFDYQIAVNGLIQAKTAAIEAEFDVIKAYYGLLHATGGEKIDE